MPLCTDLGDADFYHSTHDVQTTLRDLGHDDILVQIDHESYTYLRSLDPLFFIRNFPGQLLDFRIEVQDKRELNPWVPKHPQWIWNYCVTPTVTRLVFCMELSHSKIILTLKVLAFDFILHSDITGFIPRSDALIHWAKKVALVDVSGHPYYVNDQTHVSA